MATKLWARQRYPEKQKEADVRYKAKHLEEYKAYAKWYYLNVTKPKRKAKASTASQSSSTSSS
jgi:hypothetical protein